MSEHKAKRLSTSQLPSSSEGLEQREVQRLRKVFMERFVAIQRRLQAQRTAQLANADKESQDA